MSINLYSTEMLMQQTSLDIEKDAKTSWYWRATKKEDQKNVFISFLHKWTFMKQPVQVKPTACCSY